VNLDAEAARTIIAVTNLLGTIGVAVWAWLRGPSEANTSRLETLDEELQEQRRGLAAIEGRLQFIPTVNELGALQADMREARATQDSLRREMHQVRESLTRIEDFLLSPRTR
jgi:chromosome segregation ATPase